MDPQEKSRRVKKGKKAVAPAAVRVIARVPDEEIEVYRYAVEKDYESLLYKEEHARFFPGGLAQMTALDDGLRRAFKRFKDHSARRLEEYEANSYLEYCPPSAQQGEQEQSKL